MWTRKMAAHHCANFTDRKHTNIGLECAASSVLVEVLALTKDCIVIQYASSVVVCLAAISQSIHNYLLSHYDEAATFP